MIVRNEAHVIRRCLASVQPFIDSWVIVDTGSSDGTQQIVRDFLKDLPGALHERPWRDFGHNRSEAVALARGMGDYLFFIDADQVLVLPQGYQRPPLTAGSYLVDVRFGGVNYSLPNLVSNALPWRWVGVLHEYLECGQLVGREPLSGPYIEVHTDGARSQVGQVKKFQADAALLERALLQEPDNARHVFYLAQSYRDCGEAEKALQAYERRAAMGGWDEEVWYSLHAAALLAEQLGRPPQEVSWRYLRAYNSRPGRAEAPCDLARYLRGQQQFTAARLFAEQAMRTPPSADLLFVDRAPYLWRGADEYAIASYWCGDYAAAARVCRELLAGSALPAAERARVRANLEFSEQGLGLGKRAPIVPPLLPPLVAEQAPTVMIAILARNKAHVLPQFLRCLEQFDYPRSRIHLYVRTNDNSDGTEALLRQWLAANGARYAGVDFDHRPPQDAPGLQESGEAAQWQPHGWTAPRLKLLARIREASLRAAQALGSDYYFVIDCDNFLTPWALRCLIEDGKPMVAPMLESLPSNSRYSNYFSAVDSNGYYAEGPGYDDIRWRQRSGVFEVPLVHCTYLIDAASLPRLAYHDEQGEAMEFVVIARVARAQGIGQYIDNRHYYGELLHHLDTHLSLQQEVTIWGGLAEAVMARILPATPVG